MTRAAGIPSLVETIYQAIRSDICMGRLPPGERLNLSDLQKKYEVSLSVVREAVTRLTSERLVVSAPNQGFSVWPLSMSDLIDLTRARIGIERLVVHESVSRGDLRWESSVLAAHHRLVGTNPAQGPDRETLNFEWMAAHSEFHAALGAACQSNILKLLRQQLFDASELYRHWAMGLSSSPRRTARAEHDEMLAAAMAHDADRVTALLEQHIERTTQSIIEGRRELDRAADVKRVPKAGLSLAPDVLAHASGEDVAEPTPDMARRRGRRKQSA